MDNINSTFVVDQDNLDHCATLPLPATTASELEEGEVLLAVDHFAFTANNITYAALGKRFKYWDFFPAKAPWGQIPVWGFADVAASRHPEVPVGKRLYGYLPMARQLRVKPGKISKSTFVDSAEHRQHLALAYNQYQFTDADPAYQPQHEALQMLLRPLLITSFLLDDFLAIENFFNAEQIILTSASSKTALGLAFMLQHQRSQRGKPLTITALTSPGNIAFVESLGYYDKVVSYADIDKLDASQSSVSVDFAGNGEVLANLHKHFADNMLFSSLVGAAHWDSRGGEKNLPGAKPEVFFAPGYWEKRGKEVGNAQLMLSFAKLWAPLVASVQQWMKVTKVEGADAVEKAYKDTLQGKVHPDQGLILKM
ncbi:DUF2855 family protein [Halopseudomonas pelagia]|uniref:DUF2855 family protein n=1 Tax=Halopseudomonas pelagia TaxID=553151 RepID=UPI00039E9947|nr:DUF2855 family protein [Halopseudomonas pelagia]|tara:strand:+ start:108 stop:1211 length:1104 start_codon:yes stop_codon:yes gene_type:complete